jgi:branched-chain amino acid transport system substrate-binding protein
MHLLRFIATCLAATLVSGAAGADTFTIGIAAPTSGPSAILGQQLQQGAMAAAADAKASVAILVADDRCSKQGGADAARKFVDAKVRIVVGFLCTEAIEAALPILKAAGIAVITPGVRTNSLTDRREKTEWPVYRLGPRADGERNAAASILVKRWREVPFAIVDDGTIYGRELAESFRLAAEQAGLKPVFVDTFRPQLDNQIGLVGRLRKAAATHVLAAGDRDDIAVMGRDAVKLGIHLVIAGGEALRGKSGDVPLPVGTLMIGLPEWADVADPDVVQSLKDANIMAEGYVLPGYAAMQVAVVSASTGPTAKDVRSALDARTFDTAVGPVKFDGKGDLTTNPYRLLRFDGENFAADADGE